MTDTAAPLSWHAYADRQDARHLAAAELAGPELLAALTDGQRYELRGAVHVLWHPFAVVADCYAPNITGTPAAAVPTAAAVTCTECAARVLAEHAERLAELQPAEPAPAAPPVVVIPCGRAKLPHAAEAGRLYTGSAHRMARQAADAIAERTGARVLILSARHGLLDPSTVVEPYDETLTKRRALDGPAPVARTAARQLAELAAPVVVSLAPNLYTDALAHACRVTGAQLLAPLAGSRGIGEQRGRLAAIRDGGDLADAIADALAGTVEPAAELADLDDGPAQLALFAA